MNNKKAHIYWAFDGVIKICYLVNMCRLFSDAEYKSLLIISCLNDLGNNRATRNPGIKDSWPQGKEDRAWGSKIKKN